MVSRSFDVLRSSRGSVPVPVVAVSALSGSGVRWVGGQGTFGTKSPDLKIRTKQGASRVQRCPLGRCSGTETGLCPVPGGEEGDESWEKGLVLLSLHNHVHLQEPNSNLSEMA